MNFWYCTPVTSEFDEEPCPQNTFPITAVQNAKCEFCLQEGPMSLTNAVVLSTPRLSAALQGSVLPSSPKYTHLHLCTLLHEFSP